MQNAIDVSEWISSRPIKRFHALVTARCAVASFTEGFDPQGVGHAAVSIIRAWRLSAESFAAAFSTGLTAIGAPALAFTPALAARRRDGVASSSLAAAGSPAAVRR